MIIATCGHEVDDGISLSVDEGQFVYDLNGNQVPATTYGTYCADCVMMFYKENRILNGEIIKLIKYSKSDSENQLKDANQALDDLIEHCEDYGLKEESLAILMAVEKASVYKQKYKKCMIQGKK